MSEDPAMTELRWCQCEFTLELIKDVPDSVRLIELGRMIRKAEKRALAAEMRAG